MAAKLFLVWVISPVMEAFSLPIVLCASPPDCDKSLPAWLLF
jgi:hypothetical protein